MIGRKSFEAVGKRPSAALPSSLVTAAYFYVRLIPRDFGSLASGHFPSASQKAVFRQSLFYFACVEYTFYVADIVILTDSSFLGI